MNKIEKFGDIPQEMIVNDEIVLDREFLLDVLPEFKTEEERKAWRESVKKEIQDLKKEDGK